MAGRGPAPKDPSKRARRDSRSQRVIHIDPTPQPSIGVFRIDGEQREWLPEVLDWWGMWGDSPLSDEFTDIDWSELRITANFLNRFLYGSMEAGKEYRLRVAKFGATPEDRARLRITFAAADTAESKAPQRDRTPRKRGVLIEIPQAAGE